MELDCATADSARLGRDVLATWAGNQLPPWEPFVRRSDSAFGGMSAVP
jgi:hypothetical protein